MAALDVSPWVDGDSQELRSFKKKVVKVAKDHSNRFHCGEYRSVLRELNISETEPVVQVEVNTSTGLHAVLEVDPFDLNGLDEQAQKDLLAQKLAEYLRDSAGVDLDPSLNPVEGMTLTSRIPGSMLTTTGYDATYGVWWYFTSGEGRVRHAFREERSNGRRNQYSVCRRAETYFPSTFSSRSEDRNCAGCVKALEH